MKKNLIFFFLIGALQGFSADKEEAKPKGNHHFTVGFGEVFFQRLSTYFDLSYHQNAIRVHGRQLFYGNSFNYEYLKVNRPYLAASTRVARSYNDFRGDLEALKLSWRKCERLFIQTDLLLGFNFRKNDWFISPFIGVGGNFLEPLDHHDRHRGFKRDMPYFSFGTKVTKTVSDSLDYGLNVKFLRSFSTEDNFSAFVYMLKNMNYEYVYENMVSHPHAFGAEVSTPITWHVGKEKAWEFTLEPFFSNFGKTQNLVGTRLLIGIRL